MFQSFTNRITKYSNLINKNKISHGRLARSWKQLSSWSSCRFSKSIRNDEWCNKFGCWCNNKRNEIWEFCRV